MDDFTWYDPTTWWGDTSTTPVAPTDTSTTPTDTSATPTPTYTPSTDTGIYPDPGSPTGYSDINGNMVDSTGQPVNYDNSGQLIDSNGNVIGNACLLYTSDAADE